MSTTVCLPVLQFNAVKKQFVAARKVPQGVSESSKNGYSRPLFRASKQYRN